MKKEKNEDESFFTKKRIEFYHTNKQAVHVVTKNNGWQNGVIISIDKKFFVISDFKEGEVPIFFKEISRVSKYLPREGVV